VSAESLLLKLLRCAGPGLGVCVLLLLGACTAEPLDNYRDGSMVARPALGQERFAWLVKCSKAPTCPGPNCEDNAEGAPNGNTVDLEACGIMDVSFYGIIVPTKPAGQPELTITFGKLGGTVRVEVSSDGLRWEQPVPVDLVTVKPPLSASKTARLKVTYNEKQVYSVSHLRLIHTPLNTGVTTVDGFEGTSFIAGK
jgi:hypothetical protein